MITIDFSTLVPGDSFIFQDVEWVKISDDTPSPEVLEGTKMTYGDMVDTVEASGITPLLPIGIGLATANYGVGFFAAYQSGEQTAEVFGQVVTVNIPSVGFYMGGVATFPGGVLTIEFNEPAPITQIIMKDPHGVDRTYPAKDRLLFNTPNDGVQFYSKGNAVNDVPIALDFSAGDQRIEAPPGTLVKSAVIAKPANLLPENIVKDVEIAGVVGISEGAGGFDDVLRYFVCDVDTLNKTVTLHKVYFDRIYADTGAYDIEIPDTINGYRVVINVNASVNNV